MTTPAADETPGRSLPYWGFALVVVGYLVIIQVGGILVQELADTDSITTTRGVVLTMWIPLGAALVYTYAVVAALGWWRPVLVDHRPVRRWVWVVPIVFLACSLVAIDYAALGDKTIGYV